MLAEHSKTDSGEFRPYALGLLGVTGRNQIMYETVATEYTSICVNDEPGSAVEMYSQIHIQPKASCCDKCHSGQVGANPTGCRKNSIASIER